MMIFSPMQNILQRWSVLVISGTVCLVLGLYLLLPTLTTVCVHAYPPILSIEKRVKTILSENPLIDGHNDLLIRIRTSYHNHVYQANFTEPFQNGRFDGMVDLPRMKEGQYGGAFWSAFYPCPQAIQDFSTKNYEAIVRATLSQIDLFKRISYMYPTYFTSPISARAAADQFSSGKLISPLAIEGLHQIGNSLSNLRLYHNLGVRYATLTWNCHNAFADAAVLTYLQNGTSVKATPRWGGVTKAGQVVIREMNRMGMIVDLSHASEDTMRDVLVGEHNKDIATEETSAEDQEWHGSIAPPIFSHSSAYAICPHPRNVPDSILHLVKKRNSLVMINFSPEFISCVPASANSPSGLPEFYPGNSTLSQVVRHVMHIGELIGYDHVGIGTDFDGIENTPSGLEDVSKLPHLIAELLRRNVSDVDAAKVAGRNLLRVWADVDGVSARLQKEGMLPAEDDITV